MSDDGDSPFPPSKRGTNPASLANLRPPKKGEPSRNPEGKNGRHRSEYVAAFLERADDTALGRKMIAKLGLPEDTPRIDAILQRDTIAALGSNENARKLLIEQWGGKARMALDVSNSDGSLARASAAVGFVEAVLAAAAAKMQNPGGEGNGGDPAV